ncbi:MAG: LPS assembly lipoprotein LptE [Bdellovibrionota bacterium]
MNTNLKLFFFTSAVSIFLLSSCAYRWGTTTRSLPGGYRQVSIPIFKNKTPEVGIEVPLTNALIQEFQKSSITQVINNDKSQVEIIGEIFSLKYDSGGGGEQPSTSNYLPQGTVLAKSYNTTLDVRIRMIRKSDQVEIWSGNFRGERSYNAPFVTLSGVNSINPLYNLSARRQSIDAISLDLMAEAYDRISENF